MSVLGKNWTIQNNENDDVINKLLKIRGLTDPTELEQFRNPDFKNDFHDPFLMNGMEKAVERIQTALKNNERIIVYGDYVKKWTKALPEYSGT